MESVANATPRFFFFIRCWFLHVIATDVRLRKIRYSLWYDNLWWIDVYIVCDFWLVIIYWSFMIIRRETHMEIWVLYLTTISYYILFIHIFIYSIFIVVLVLLLYITTWCEISISKIITTRDTTLFVFLFSLCPKYNEYNSK